LYLAAAFLFCRDAQAVLFRIFIRGRDFAFVVHPVRVIDSLVIYVGVGGLSRLGISAPNTTIAKPFAKSLVFE
jgi:hypothetical protein